MKQLTFMGGSGETYESPATRIITINVSSVLMNSTFETKGSNSSELDELGTTDTGSITWN